MRQMVSALLLGVLALVLPGSVFGVAKPAQSSQAQRQLVLLIAGPHNAREVAMVNDIKAFHKAFQQRGVPAQKILTHEGDLSQLSLFAFLKSAADRVAGWPDGTVVLVYSGHGKVGYDRMGNVKPALLLADGSVILWDEIFQALNLPPNVRLILVPDC